MEKYYQLLDTKKILTKSEWLKEMPMSQVAALFAAQITGRMCDLTKKLSKIDTNTDEGLEKAFNLHIEYNLLIEVGYKQGEGSGSSEDDGEGDGSGEDD